MLTKVNLKVSVREFLRCGKFETVEKVFPLKRRLRNPQSSSKVLIKARNLMA